MVQEGSDLEAEDTSASDRALQEDKKKKQIRGPVDRSKEMGAEK